MRGLKAQIVLWTILPLTLVLIGVAFTGVYSHERAMRALVQERDRALAQVGASGVRDRLQEQAAVLQTLARQEAFVHGDSQAQRDLLAGAGDVAFVDRQGAWLTGGEEAPPWTRDEQAAALVQTVWADQTAALVGPGAEGLYFLGVPVRDQEGAVYGLLVAPLSVEGLGLGDLLAQLRIGEGSRAYLVDGAGRVLACASADEAGCDLSSHPCLETALQDGGAGVVFCRSPAEGRKTLAYAPVQFDGVGWRVLIEASWNQVIGPVLRYSQFMPLVAALAVIVSLLTLYYGVRAIARPLQKLGAQAERVAWGDFEAIGAPVGGVAEIEDLRRTLDHMARRIQSYQRGMHDYIAAMTQGQEEERKRLARELHDDTVQSLIALNQQVEMAHKRLTADPAGAAERLARVQAMLTETIEGVRRFSRDLRPIYLEDLGFLPALEMLVREADRREGLSVRLTVSGPVRRLPPDLELTA
ncbi:MAG TPA: HAMP domain-containing protein, partial [Anaerolineae bacterium]|nr:HAMP domain-containing protein [Anaerolineae bacterium]